MPRADAQDALGIDAFKSKRAYQAGRVVMPEEINEVFDGIAYLHSAAVLRMIETYVGS